MTDEEREKTEIQRNAEAIKEYMQLLGFDERGETNSRPKFTLSFSVDELGTVDVEVIWPDEKNEKHLELIKTSANLLYSINSGSLKSLVVEAIQNTKNLDPELLQDAQKLIKYWSIVEKKYSSEPCVKPRDTLT
tara:strand:+ start:9807 stop:10208 length:402 start_codon:yes stop_codon:yes gene_type:complete